MRYAAFVLSLIALTAPKPSVAAIYDFTVELPASLGAPGGRGVAPMVRLTFELDTAQATTGPTFYTQSTTVFPSVPVTVFTYLTASTTTVNYYLGILPYSFDLTDLTYQNDTYVLDSHFIQFSSGIGTGITFAIGSAPADYVDFLAYRRQNGTVTVTQASAASVPEAPSWTILCAALGVVAGWRRRFRREG